MNDRSDAVPSDDTQHITVLPQRVLAAARYPRRMWSATWQSSPAAAVTVDAVRRWSLHPEPAGLCLYGPSKAGKTTLAVLAARMLYMHGYTSAPYIPGAALTAWHLMASDVRGAESDDVWHAANESAYAAHIYAPILYTTWAELELRLRAALAAGHFEKVLDAIETDVACLVLDDIDMATATPWREQVLYLLLERPARGRRIIVTLNRAPHDAAESVLTERLVTRLTDPGLFFAREITR